MGRWGAGKINLMRTATAGEVPYGWSSDGTKILYQSGASIWVMSGLNRKEAHRRVRARRRLVAVVNISNQLMQAPQHSLQ
jgi:hypothetical protein